MGRFRWCGALAAGLGGMAATAEAHSISPGAGELAGGLLHPLTTPAHLLALVATGLWLGQRKPPQFRWFFRIFAPVSGVALAFSGGMPVWPAQPVLAALALTVGLFIALEWRPPTMVQAAVLAAAGAAVALDSGVDVPTGNVWKVLLGTWLGMQLIVLNVAYYLSLRPGAQWASVGVRVLGSWTVAISLLLLAFAWRH